MTWAISILTSDGALASGQNDSCCPIGTPVFGLSLTYISQPQECHVVIKVLTNNGVLASGQNDSGIGQCPIGTPVFGSNIYQPTTWMSCGDCFTYQGWGINIRPEWLQYRPVSNQYSRLWVGSNINQPTTRMAWHGQFLYLPVMGH